MLQATQGDFAKPPEKRFNYKHCFDALFRVGFQQSGDAPLLDHAVGIDAHAGIEKQLTDILQTGRFTVDVVFAGA